MARLKIWFIRDFREDGEAIISGARCFPGATLKPFRWLGGVLAISRTPPNENLRVAPSRAGLCVGWAPSRESRKNHKPLSEGVHICKRRYWKA